ncbi:MAG: hypothetical protein R3195_08675 [Gemmatimonadota bacterium]|nr:hypothetical protein [Gemmatimonadota bacterium]
MSERKEGRISRLPADPAYWDGLADRVVTRSEPALARRRARAGARPVWWARPEWSPALAFGAALFAVAAWWLVPDRGPAASAVPPSVAAALQPGDPLAARMLEPSAPDLAALMSSGVASTVVREE